MSTIDMLRTCAQNYAATTGEPATDVYVGRAVLDDIADETYPLMPRDMGLLQWRERCAKEAEEGRLQLHGLKVWLDERRCESGISNG